MAKRESTWTKEDKNLLIENYNKKTNKELLALFPNRTFLGIYKKARALGMYKSKEIEYKNRCGRKGEKSPSWKGGRKITPKGYYAIMKPEHPRADIGGYVLEHIVVFEEATGIQVPKECAIHHIDGNKLNNNINNLCMMTFGAHSAFHNRKRSEKK